MNQYHPLLLHIVQNNHSITAAWLDHSTTPPTLKLLTSTDSQATTYTLPEALANLPRNVIQGTPLRTREAPLDHLSPFNQHQACFNELVPLGVQIQPQG